ncbi:MAG: polysulfide reductase NrfD, partial [Proteobacteria bacterium]|nr:polysulfide reductase NrfD [Pseudomonadota bacterium]
NIFLYTGFIALVVVYLWMMFEPRMNRFVGRVGTTAFAWRLILTTGTGSIFAFLAAREAFDSAVLAPMFIAMSLSFGTALTLIFSALIFSIRGDGLPTALMLNLRRLLGYFVVAVAFFVMVDHLTRLYGAEHHSMERFILLEGGIYPMLFWIGQILLGTILPVVMLLQRRCNTLAPTLVAASLVLVGAFCQLYVLIIGGQAFPIDIVPGFSETSGFFDGVIAEYQPSLAEFGLGMGGVGLALLTYLIGTRVLAFLPTTGFDSGPSS